VKQIETGSHTPPPRSSERASRALRRKAPRAPPKRRARCGRAAGCDPPRSCQRQTGPRASKGRWALGCRGGGGVRCSAVQLQSAQRSVESSQQLRLLSTLAGPFSLSLPAHEPAVRRRTLGTPRRSRRVLTKLRMDLRLPGTEFSAPCGLQLPQGGSPGSPTPLYTASINLVFLYYPLYCLLHRCPDGPRPRQKVQ